MSIQVKKICAGCYEYTLDDRRVMVEKFDFGWIARAQWTAHLYTDPLDTKKDAVENAKDMLVND